MVQTATFTIDRLSKPHMVQDINVFWTFPRIKTRKFRKQLRIQTTEKNHATQLLAAKGLQSGSRGINLYSKWL